MPAAVSLPPNTGRYQEVPPALTLSLYRDFLGDPCEEKLLRAYNAVVFLARMAVDRYDMKGFDRAAAEADVCVKLYYVLANRMVDMHQLTSGKYLAYLFTIARSVVCDYHADNGAQDWRNLDANIRLYYLSMYRTTRDVEIKLFFEDELIPQVRKDVIRQIRFGGKEYIYCRTILDGLLKGRTLSSIRPKVRVAKGSRFFRRYIAFLVRQHLARYVPDYLDDPRADILRTLWDCTEYGYCEEVGTIKP